MSNRNVAGNRTIHLRALVQLGENACIVALGVARDLRSGAIPPEDFDMTVYCGTSCCIGGHIANRLGYEDDDSRIRFGASRRRLSVGLDSLFDQRQPSNPRLASDAIERYVYDGSTTPWKA